MKKIFNAIILASIVLSGAAQAAVTVRFAAGKGLVPGDKIYFRYGWIGKMLSRELQWIDSFGFFVNAGETVTHAPEGWNIKNLYEVYAQPTATTPAEQADGLYKRITVDGTEYALMARDNTIREGGDQQVTVGLELDRTGGKLKANWTITSRYGIRGDK